MSEELSAVAVWNEGKISEKEFWQGIFENHEIDAHSENSRVVPQEVIEAYGEVPTGDGPPLRLLDVGSGPISKLGGCWPDKTVLLTCIDPLAEFYSDLLEKYCPALKARPVFGEGESLLTQFEAQSFDVIYSLNALDHAYDPMLAIKNMAELIKPGGLVYFVVLEDEAEFWSYEGMHQWNFRIKDARLTLRDRNSQPVDCITELDPEKYILTCENCPTAVFENTPYEQLRNFIHVTIRKKTDVCRGKAR